ncbi:MAG: hypothetical protein QXX95_01095 [Nitrososphaerales archaeon]
MMKEKNFILFLLILLLLLPNVSAYEFIDKGNQSIKNVLYNPQFDLFKEAPSQPYSYWLDDHAKLLRSFNLRPDEEKQRVILNFIKKYSYDGYVPRRWIDTQPQILQNTHGAWNDPPNKNLSITNQLYRIDGVPNLGYKDPKKLLQIYHPIEPTLKLAYMQGSNYEYKTSDDPKVSSVSINMDSGLGQAVNNAGFDAQYHDPWQADPLTVSRTTYIREDPSFQYVNGVQTYGKLLATSPGSSEASIPTSNTQGTLSVSWFQNHISYPIQNNKPYMIWGTTSATFQYEPKSGESDICGYQPVNDPCITSHPMYAKLTIGFVQSNGNIFTLSEGSSQLITVQGAGSFTITASFTGFYQGKEYGAHSTFVANKQPNQDALYIRLDVFGIPLRQDQTKYPGQYNVVLIKYNTISSYVNWSINYNIPDIGTESYNSPQKALKLYYGDENQASRNIQQKFSFSLSYLSIKSFWWWDYSSSPTPYIMKILYSDGTSKSFPTIATNTWTLRTHFKSELNATKSVIGVRFETNSLNTVFIDDVTFNANFGSSTSYLESTSNSVSLVHEQLSPNVRATIKYTLQKNSSYMLVNTTITNLSSNILTNIKFRNAFDGLDTLGAGYKYIYFPGVGWEEPGVQSPYEFTAPHLSTWKYNYMIVSIKRIPDWIGSYGIAIIINPSIFADSSPIKFTKVINTRYFNSTQAPSPAGYLHWLQLEHSLPNLNPNQSISFQLKIVFMTTWDYTNPDIYEQFFAYDNIENPRFKGVDFSNNFYYGEIAYELVNNYAITKDPNTLSLALKIWNYYWRMLNAQTMGTYVPSLAQFVRASLRLYDLTNNATYLSIAYQSANKLLEHQVLNPEPQDPPGVIGTFRMKGNLINAKGVRLNETSYLDVTANAIIALREAYERSGGTAYLEAVNRGLNSIHYSTRPQGYTLLPMGAMSIPNPNLPRIWIYANKNRIDHDYSTYKASLVLEASLGMNDTLAFIALSRLWQRTVYNSTITEIHTGEWSSPNIEMNSETQPWGLYSWYKVANYMQKKFEGVYVEFIDFPDNDNPHLIKAMDYLNYADYPEGATTGRTLKITIDANGYVSFRIYSSRQPSAVLLDDIPIAWNYDGNIIKFTILFQSIHDVKVIWRGSAREGEGGRDNIYYLTIKPLYLTGSPNQIINTAIKIENPFSNWFLIERANLPSYIILVHSLPRSYEGSEIEIPITVQIPESSVSEPLSLSGRILQGEAIASGQINIEVSKIEERIAKPLIPIFGTSACTIGGLAFFGIIGAIIGAILCSLSSFYLLSFPQYLIPLLLFFLMVSILLLPRAIRKVRRREFKI